MNNELLFYGGIVITSLSIICLLFCIVINRIRSIKLNHILDEEYGKEKKVSD